MKDRAHRTQFYINAITDLNKTICNYESCLRKTIEERNVLIAASRQLLLKEAQCWNTNAMFDSPLQKSLVSSK